MFAILLLFFLIGIYAFGLRWLIKIFLLSCLICFILYLIGPPT